MEMSKIFFIFVLILASIVCQSEALPQFGGGARGRAISNGNTINDADDDDDNYDDYDNRPRKYGRRGYRSRCRCAKITNCPKLQITIPRCPPEEFVCCFT